MAVTLYTYSKLCDSGRLSKEIKESSDIIVGEDHIETIASPATTKVYMKDALSTEEEDALDALVTAHVNTPLPDDGAKLVTTGSKDSMLGREVFSVSAFAVNTDYEVKATGFKTTVTAGQTVNIDHAVGAEDRYINGVGIYCEDAAMGDTCDFFVVDKDRVYNGILYPDGYLAPNEVPLKQFGFDWNVYPGQLQQLVFNYLARLPAGVYVRLKYKSGGGTNVKVGCNLFLHKKVT